MKLFTRKFCCALVAGVSLLAGAGAVHAYDTETGQVKLVNFVTGYYQAGTNAAAVMMATPVTLGTGRCPGTGHPLMIALDGEGSKATVATLLAANIAGKSVTVEYMYDSNGGECLLASAKLN